MAKRKPKPENDLADQMSIRQAAVDDHKAGRRPFVSDEPVRNCAHCEGLSMCECPACTLRKGEIAPCSMCNIDARKKWLESLAPSPGFWEVTDSKANYL